MKFTAIGRTMGDETTPYAVTEYRAKTAAEFVNEVLEDKREWGYVRVKSASPSGFLGGESVEYRYGELLGAIPETWKRIEIGKIESSGGWSRMDFYITPK